MNVDLIDWANHRFYLPSSFSDRIGDADLGSYNFLKENEHLGNNIILLTLGGSYAYSTNVEGSDIDLRGCALDSKINILTDQKFEQFTDDATDTVIYGFNKLIKLLTQCNPNVIEMLGGRDVDYFYISPIGRELMDNSSMFLSRQAAQSFGGYATAQLRRLDNKSARDLSQEQEEMHILNSIMNAYATFPEKYFEFDEDSIKLYVDKSPRDEYESEIFMDINLRHYPLRDYKLMWSEMHNIVKDYHRLGKRNSNAITRGKLGKHMMHLIRLYMMGLDILEGRGIVTYREKEHDFLMDIRNGKYLDENNQPVKEFFEIVDEYEMKFYYMKEHTSLPDKPNYKKINEFVAYVNERVVKGEI